MDETAGQEPEPVTWGGMAAKWSEALASGDLRRGLEALRDRLTGELMVAEGAAVAALAKQLHDVLVRLDGIRVPEVSAVDEIANRRARRRATELPDEAAVGDERGSGGKRPRGKRGPDA